ncbi:MAG: HAMP domain-containing protein [Gammaproteobacteria bacterium]|nr:HAMP domain-containing protein [Gammaproteobacteria bacterium]
MRKESRYFASRAARRVFHALILGFVVLIAASIFVYSGLRPFVWRAHNRIIHVNQVTRVVKIADKVPAYALPRIIRTKNNRVLYFHLGAHPYTNFKQLSLTDPEKIRAWLLAHHKVAKVSILVNDGQWLNVVIHTSPVRWWILIGFSLLVLVLLFAMIALSFWSVKYLASPLTDFARAVKRFGVDLYAPPIAESGTEEIREIAHAFNQMQERIRKLIGDRTQMLAAISHDLRTPITRLKLRAEYLEDSEHYEKIHADLTEMENMLSSVLTFAREDARDEPMERFDLEALMDSMCEDMVESGMRVSYESDGERLPFFGKMSALKRALGNLIENAVKYGSEARVKLTKKSVHIHIVIEDSGPGIPAAELQQVFEPFYRVEQSRSRSTGGTGLGLVIARDAMRSHGGDVELKNLAKGGLRAEVILPFNKEL